MDERGYIVGVGVAWEGGKGYWPVRHEPGGNFDPDLVFRWIRHYAHGDDVQWVFHNAMYDRGWFSTEGIHFHRVHDTQTAAPLLNEYRDSYSLDNLAIHYTGKGKSQEGMNRALLELSQKLGRKDKKPDKGLIWRLRPEQVGEYGEDDAARTRALWLVLEEHLTAEDLWRVYNMEIELQDVLLDMRRRGIRIDADKLEPARKTLHRMAEEAQTEINRAAGFHVNVNSGEDIAKLFDKHGVTYPLTPKTKKPSFTQDWLLAHEDPVAKLIVAARKPMKTVSTFVEGFFIQKQVSGRIHPEIIPLARGEDGGAVSGRMSARNPNVMNPPNLEKDPFSGKLIREIFLPEEGCKWASCDYSQQEPRLAVHYASVAGFRSVEAFVKAYNEDVTTDMHTLTAQIMGIGRKPAKIMNLALMYGRGGASTCHQLGLPTEWKTVRGRPLEVAGPEGQALIDTYFDKMAFVKDLSDECKRRAKKRGYILTLGGRKCRFYQEGVPETEGYGFTYKALNALIQGSAADQTKLAMIEYWKEFKVPPLVPVHDELGLNDPQDGSVQRAVQIMRDVVQLRVPMLVDLAIGNSWGECV
jgi:DNA polymerase I-like protein with 3'-5' exonuclease and polymerase domains